MALGQPACIKYLCLGDSADQNAVLGVFDHMTKFKGRSLSVMKFKPKTKSEIKLHLKEEKVHVCFIFLSATRSKQEEKLSLVTEIRNMVDAVPIIVILGDLADNRGSDDAGRDRLSIAKLKKHSQVKRDKVYLTDTCTLKETNFAMPIHLAFSYNVGNCGKPAETNLEGSNIAES